MKIAPSSQQHYAIVIRYSLVFESFAAIQLVREFRMTASNNDQEIEIGGTPGLMPMTPMPATTHGNAWSIVGNAGVT
jgi:hypothetical protein